MVFNSFKVHNQKREEQKLWTHWELNPTPLAYHVLWTNSRCMLSERDNQLHHVPLERTF
jgi:hypothetical protein